MRAADGASKKRRRTDAFDARIGVTAPVRSCGRGRGRRPDAVTPTSSSSEPASPSLLSSSAVTCLAPFPAASPRPSALDGAAAAACRTIIVASGFSASNASIGARRVTELSEVTEALPSRAAMGFAPLRIRRRIRRR